MRWLRWGEINSPALSIRASPASCCWSPTPKGTRYTAIARHGDAACAKQHAEMGFHEGWGIALDQLVATAKQG